MGSLLEEVKAPAPAGQPLTRPLPFPPSPSGRPPEAVCFQLERLQCTTPAPTQGQTRPVSQPDSRAHLSPSPSPSPRHHPAASRRCHPAVGPSEQEVRPARDLVARHIHARRWDLNRTEVQGLLLQQDFQGPGVRGMSRCVIYRGGQIVGPGLSYGQNRGTEPGGVLLSPLLRAPESCQV